MRCLHVMTYDMRDPHPFTLAKQKNSTACFRCLKNKQRAGDIVMMGIDKLHHAFRGLKALENFWKNGLP